MLKLSGIVKSFPAHQILHGLDLEVGAESLTGLIGPSGCGKSVLLKIIGGVTDFDRGQISYGAIRPDKISLMFQEGALFDSLSVFDNVAFPLVAGAVPASLLPKEIKTEVHRKVSDVLGKVGLQQAAFKMPGQLSGGMRRRASLARALVCRPDLLLLDDPTAGLDPIASSVIMDLIVKIQRETKTTCIVVSHDLRRLLPVVDRIQALFSGKIIFSGTLSDLKSSNNAALLNFVSCRFQLDSVPRPEVRA